MMMDRARQDEDANLSRVPVFVYPASIFFNAHDRDNLKQVLTIYNPYEFGIRFRVFSTAPDLYTVINPDGSIKSKNCMDLIIRVSGDIPHDNNVPLEHKFRVQIYHYSNKKPLGRKDIQSVIHFGSVPPHLSSGSDPSSFSADSFLQCPPGSNTASGNIVTKEHPIAASNTGSSGFLTSNQQPNYVIIVTALVCIIGLMLPTSSESCSEGIPASNSAETQTTASLLPTYLHLSVNQKLLLAYTLGLVTMVIFRP